MRNRMATYHWLLDDKVPDATVCEIMHIGAADT